MRRPVLYLAGLLMATGASLALAGPASAAPSNYPHHRHHHHYIHNANWWNDGCSYGDHGNHYNNGNHYNGINILNGILNGGL
jgi:hypothetical protein